MNNIKELINKLNYYREQYYNYNNSIISDKEYDELYDKLIQLEKETGIIMSNSPTQTIGASILKNLPKIKHSHKLLSLDKTKDINILNSFINNKKCLLSLKMDGLTILLTYENGILIQAETRGDGEEGQLITEAVKQFINVPLQIPYKEHFEIEGEAIISLKDFENMKEIGYTNPRNLASGSLSLLDVNLIKQRRLQFITWKVYTDIGKTYTDRFNKAETFGFTIVPYITTNFVSNDLITELKAKAKQMYYPIDGLVCSYNDIQYGLSLGETSHAPKHSLAYKFYDEEYETTLKDIEWTMGRTGVLTPVAILEPVEIDGTEVSRASLHNISIIKELGLNHYGCKVSVYKANQIIPQISQVIEDNSQEVIIYPSICPICGGQTSIHKDNDSEVLFCDNPQCQGKLINIIDHMCGKKGLDIKGLSKATIQKLLDWGWIKSKKDIFELKNHKEEWTKKSGFGEKSVNNILEAIEKSKNTSLDKVIAAAGIPEIGISVSKDLAKNYKNWNDFRSEMDYSRIEGIGEVMNENLLSFDYSEMDEIVEKYLIFEKNNVIINTENENKINNLTIVITGKLENGTRDDLKSKIESLGGKVTGSISSKTSLLINNDATSQTIKNQKAKELGIPIITEKEFYEKYLNF